MQDRFIIKKLNEFALKEYKEKRPAEIVGYRVKKSVLLQRGFGPSIILSGLKGKVVPYLLLADYGDQYRLYYFLENGVILSAINISKLDFKQENVKFQKATTKLFQIPKPQVPEKQIEKIKKQLNEKFQYYVTLIEKQTSCKVKSIPLITIYQSPLENKLIIKREVDFIKFPLELVAHKLLDGFLLREAYHLILPSFINNTKHEKNIRLIGAYFSLKKTMKQNWLRYWTTKERLNKKLIQLNEDIFNSYLKFLCYLSKYESAQFQDSQSEKLFSTFLESSRKISSIPEVAAQCYLKLAKIEGIFIIKAALFFILANNLKESKNILKVLSKFSPSDEIDKLKNCIEYLASYQLAKIYSAKPKFDSVSPDIQKLFNETFDHLKTQVLEVIRIHNQKSSPRKKIPIKFKIKNQTDLTFQNVELNDDLPKKGQIELLSSNNFYFNQIRPNENITCEYKLSCHTPQKIWFRNGNLTFEDSFGNHYVQTIPPTLLQIQ